MNQNNSGKKKEIPVTLTVGGKTFAVKFYDNQTARALVKKMPMTLSTSYQYTAVGYMEDVSGFVKAVGDGNVKITFQKR